VAMRPGGFGDDDFPAISPCLTPDVVLEVLLTSLKLFVYFPVVA
jgi:hypothetical protein